MISPHLLAHRLADNIRLPKAVPGKLLRNLQHLVLVHDDAVRLMQDVPEVVVRERGGNLPLLAVDIAW